MTERQGSQSSAEDGAVSIQVASLLLSGRQVSWEMLVQLPEACPLDEARMIVLGRLLGTVSCPAARYAPPDWEWRCPISQHRHVLWRRDDGELRCWTLTDRWWKTMVNRVKRQWGERSQELFDLLALVGSIEESSPPPARVEVPPGTRAFHPSPEISTLVRELAFAGRVHARDLARLRSQYVPHPCGDAEPGDSIEWQLLATLVAAQEVLDRFADQNVSFIHPAQVAPGTFYRPEMHVISPSGEIAFYRPQEGEVAAGERLFCVAPEPAELIDAGKLFQTHFWGVRLLLAKGIVQRQLQMVERAARLAWSRRATDLPASQRDPLPGAPLPSSARLNTQLRREHEAYLEWMARLEEVELQMAHALPHFFVPQPTRERPAGSTAADGGRRAATPPAGGDRESMPVFRPGWPAHEVGVAGYWHIPGEPPGAPGVPVPSGDQRRAGQVRGDLGGQPATGEQAAPPPSQGTSLVFDPLLWILVTAGGMYSVLFAWGWRATPPPVEVLYPLGVILLYLYIAFVCVDGFCTRQLVAQVRRRRWRRWAPMLPIAVQWSLRFRNIPLRGEVRWHLFSFSYATAFLLFWFDLASRQYIDLQTPIGTTVPLVFILLWTIHLGRGGFQVLTRFLPGLFFAMRRPRRANRRE